MKRPAKAKELRWLDLDAIDLRILAALQENARIANTDLSAAVGLSPAPCLRRVRALEERGVIRKHVTLVSPAAVGLPVSVFVSISLERQVEEALKRFERVIRPHFERVLAERWPSEVPINPEACELIN